MSQLRTIILYGPLRSKFGRRFQFLLDGNTAAEAFQALCSQVEGFRSFLAQAKDRGLGFAIFAGKKNLKEDDLNKPSGSDDIRIAPVLLGSKSGGVFNIIMGAVLIVVGGFISGWSMGAGSGIGGVLMQTGIGMMAGGVVQMLSPQPKGLKNGDRPDNQPSYVFNGAVNTQAQGNPVPLLYGRLIVGSAVVSAGIHADDYAPATSGTGIGALLSGRRPKNFYEPL
ncbi:tail assembly protein [Dyella silvatica]|uniref:tail assembly protein n=1 Tax=Dyella silvatica TaxID=2992128 RepID=UPI00224EAF8B|nr:tail assembly protein [Dyella silvatica]